MDHFDISFACSIFSKSWEVTNYGFLGVAHPRSVRCRFQHVWLTRDQFGMTVLEKLGLMDMSDLLGLPRHDMEVEGVAVKDDAVLELRVSCCTCSAQAHVPKRRGHHRVPRVLMLAAVT